MVLRFYELPWICISLTSYRFQSTLTYLSASYLILATALWGGQAGMSLFSYPHVRDGEIEVQKGEVLAIETRASWCWPGLERTCGDFLQAARLAQGPLLCHPGGDGDAGQSVRI